MQKVILFIFCIFFITFKQSHAKDEYFMTLRHDIVNLRQGPSKDYPIKIFYKKKFLPVLIQDISIILEKLEIMKIILGGYIFLNYQKKRQQ